MAKPVVDGLERKHDGRMRVARVDINEPAGAELATRYGIRGVPAFILLDDRGQMIWRKLGGTPDEPAIGKKLDEIEARQR